MMLIRGLQIGMAGLSVFGTVLLGMGEQTAGLEERAVLLPTLTLLVAISSVYVTDIHGWLRLNVLVSNLAGLAAMVIALYDFSDFERENQLLALANFLIYMQLILLYREKTVHIYWLLSVVSLLQVAVSAALNFSVWFGVLLVVYLFVALIVMTLFYLYREQVRHTALAARAEWKGRQAARAASWSTADSRLWSGPHVEMPRGALAGEFFRRIVLLGITSVALTWIVFFAMPRAGEKSWRTVGSGPPQSMVGYSNSVELGREFGQIADDPSQVMQVRFVRNGFNEPYSVNCEPYFRGAIHTSYDAGRWSTRFEWPDTDVSATWPTNNDSVRMLIEIEPMKVPVLPTVFPVQEHSPARPEIRFERVRAQLIRAQNEKRRHCEVVTNGFRDGMQVPITPALNPPTGEQLAKLTEWDEEKALRFPRLQAQAAEWLAGAATEATVERAGRLERRLMDPALFSYTLTPPRRDEELDPLEDFVAVNRAGHCEYFASALCLMLRSQKIPARLVIGFKGGDWNSLGDFLCVRQLHAHAWVEVYLTQNELPRDSLYQGRQWAAGGWLRLDPTPGDEADEIRRRGRGWMSWRQLTDYAQYLWTNYVLNLDARRQNESIYARARAFLAPLANWREWFSWRGALVAIVAMAGGAIAWRMIRPFWPRRWRWARRWSAAKRRGARGGPTVDFYVRLEAILARCGCARGVGQTPWEFARAAAGQLAETPGMTDVAALPRWIADLYYRVRYGGRPLEADERRAVDAALGRMEERITAAANGATRK